MDGRHVEHLLLFAGGGNLFVLGLELQDEPYTDDELSEADTDDGLPALLADVAAHDPAAGWRLPGGGVLYRS